MGNRTTKKFKSTLSARRGCTHAVRQVQDEYMSERRGLASVAETYCGRKRPVKGGGPDTKGLKSAKDDATIIAGVVDCQSCLKAMAAGAS